MPALATQTRTVEQAGALSNDDLIKVGFKIPRDERSEILEASKAVGLKSMSEYLRLAWRLAKKHPEMLDEVKKEELEYQRSRPMSSWHPDAQKD